jgi:hypothetical protein
MTARLNDVAQAPNRTQQAQDNFKLIRESTQGDYDQSIRDVGRDAAKFGRIGSGMTTSKVGDIFTQRESSLDRTARDLALQATSQERDDRMGALDATRSTANDLFGMDSSADQRDQERSRLLGTFGDREFDVARTERGDNTQERDFFAQRDNTAQEQGQFDRNLLARLGEQEAGLVSTERRASENDRDFFDSSERQDRGEMRGERQFQSDTERAAFERDLLRRNTDESLMNSQFEREFRINQLMAQLGYRE